MHFAANCFPTNFRLASAYFILYTTHCAYSLLYTTHCTLFALQTPVLCNTHPYSVIRCKVLHSVELDKILCSVAKCTVAKCIVHSALQCQVAEYGVKEVRAKEVADD